MSGKRKYRSPEKHTVRKIVATFIIMTVMALLFPAVVMAAGQAYRAEILRKNEVMWMQSAQPRHSDETGGGLVKPDIGINVSQAQAGGGQLQQSGGQVQQTGAINESQAQPGEEQLQQSSGQMMEQADSINGSQTQQSNVTGTSSQDTGRSGSLSSTSIRPANSTIFFPVFSTVMPLIAGITILAACYMLMHQEHVKKSSRRRKKEGRSKKNKTM